MSSKDKDKPMHEKFKSFFKNLKPKELPNKSKDEFVLTTELQQELSKDAPIATRLKAIRQLMEIIKKCKLHEHIIPKVWAHIKDLPDDSVCEHRQLAYQVLQALVQMQKSQLSGIFRAQVFRVIVEHKYHEDTAMQFNLLHSLSENGKDISYFDEKMAPFLLNWLPSVTKAGKTNEFLLLLITLIKFNAAHVKESDIHQFIVYICSLCDNTQGTIVSNALNFLETIIAYYRNLPPDSLPQIIGTLCLVVNSEAHCQMSWKVMRNLLGTHLGHAALFTMCHILQSPDVSTNTYLIRGAIFFIQMGLWGNPVSTLRCPSSAVLPAIYEAVKTGHHVIVFEAVTSVQKLVQKCSSELQEPSWDIILKILASAVKHIGGLLDAQHPLQLKVPLNETLTSIEMLIDEGHFNGDVEAFYAIVAECAHVRPESSIMKLIEHLAEHIHPVRNMWLAKLNTLMNRYYRIEKEKRTNIRLKVLDILMNIVQLHRMFYEDELVDKIVIPYLINLHADHDYKIRSVGADLLIRLCTECDSSKWCMEMLDILEKVIKRPFDISTENLPAAETDTADVKAIISHLIDLFEAKIHKLPSMPAVRIYKILMSHLEIHYTRPRVFENCNYVRQQIFECFLRMRADDFYRIGCPRNGELKFSPYLCVTYTPPTDRTSLSSPPPPNSPAAIVQQSQTHTNINCAITYVKIKSAFKIFITCLTDERDTEVLIFVLKELPDVLQNKSLVLTKNGNNDIGLLINAVSKLMKCLPDNASVNRTEFCSSLLLILSGLASYHAYLYPTDQREMIRLLSTCKVRHSVPCFSQCIRALTTCTLEMQDVMVKILPEVLLQLSKTTATAQIAIPMLEFLSTLTTLPSVFSNFVADQYMAIFAMLLPYTNPFNYNTYTVFLAHHLIAVWFLKCRLTFRKDFVSYITNGLNTNSFSPFNESSTIAKGDINPLNQDSSSRKRSSSLTEQSSRKRERSATLVTKGYEVQIDKTLMKFYRELTETCIDLMARYTFSPCSALPKRLPNADFLFSGGQSMSWLLGNRVITITTSGCAQKALKHGLCDKCYATCKGGTKTPEYSRLQRTGSSEVDRITRQNSGSNNNTSTSSPTDDGRPFSDKLEQLPNKLQQLAGGETASKPEKKEHCACWCQNWAEIHVRRPTGNMSWVMRIQNQTADVKSIYDFPLNEISTLFMPSLHVDAIVQQDSIEEESLPMQPLTQPISIPGSPSKQSPSRQSSRDSIDEDLEHVYEDGTRTRNPVRRSNSSPEMSADWKNPFMQQKACDEDEPTKKKNFSKDSRVSCEAIPEEIAGMGTTPPSGEPAPHPALLSSLSCPGPEQDPPVQVPKGYATVPPTPNVLTQGGAQFYPAVASSKERPTLNLPLTSKPPQSPTQTSPRLSRHNIKEREGHEIQKSSSLVLQKQKAKLDGFNQIDQKRDRGYTISEMQSPTRKNRLVETTTANQQAGGSKSKDMPKSGINPAFVFLQLYHAAQFGNAAEIPFLLSSNDVGQRALNILDTIQPYETHKIGVIYIGHGQCNKEAEILHNCYGSLRYVDFLKRLGTMIKVQDVDPFAFFLGGLDADGGDGSFAYMWQDDIIRVIFHVATLMPNSDFEPNCNQKKAHIGNDYVTIVYNESGEDYNINTIKGQFNFASIIIQPLDHNSNKVTVKAKDVIVELIGQSEARIVSDQNVALLARQLALHANLAALIQSNSMKEGGEPYAPNWLQRLRRIKKLREKIQQSKGADYSARTRAVQMEDFTLYT